MNNGNIVLVRVCSGIPEYVIIDGRCISREEQGSYEDAFGFAIKFIFRTED
ncbi:MAG: hypothetical protein LBF15_03485 [Candidatus Peribacteria bacterium]|nr:hypothetical protein [Candidatus Peribacteria bacterium]